MANFKEPAQISYYKNKWNFNIGLILFGVIFIYLVVTVLTYLTAKHVSVYEVREGSIIKDTSYSGFVTRSEIPVSAEGNGYLNFYVEDQSKISAGMKVYALSEKKIEPVKVGEEESTSLSSEQEQLISTKTQTFISQFEHSKFTDTYAFKKEISSILTANESQNRVAQLDSLAQDAETEGMSVFSSLEDGLIVYGTDGYEHIKPEQVGEAEFDRTKYAPKPAQNNQKVKNGEPIYKLLNDESWTVVIKLTKKSAAELDEVKQIKVRFAKDNQEMMASVSLAEKGKNNYYAYLTFERALVRYSTDRYLDIELIMEDQSGLKIPKSAKAEKECFIIPTEYLTQGGNSQNSGVMLLKKNGKNESAPVFTTVNVYSTNEETGLAYLGMDTLSKGDMIVKPDSDATVKIEKTEKLDGVFNINKGYAVFHTITILSESEDYYIVRQGSRYGLSNYDHIALDGDEIRENDVVF